MDVCPAPFNFNAHSPDGSFSYDEPFTYPLGPILGNDGWDGGSSGGSGEPQIVTNGAGPALLTSKQVNNSTAWTDIDWSKPFHLTAVVNCQATPVLFSATTIRINSGSLMSVVFDQGSGTVSAGNIQISSNFGFGASPITIPVTPGLHTYEAIGTAPGVVDTYWDGVLIDSPGSSAITPGSLILFFRNGSANPSVLIRHITLTGRSL